MTTVVSNHGYKLTKWFKDVNYEAQGGVRGHIRSWAAMPEVGVLLYNIGANRWCGRVGRPHKSNGARLQAHAVSPRCSKPYHVLCGHHGACDSARLRASEDHASGPIPVMCCSNT